MTDSPEFASHLQTLALSTTVPPEIRQEAIRSQFSVAPDAALETAVAAIGSTKGGSQKGQLVDVITANASKLPPNGNTDQALRQLSQDLRAQQGSDRVTTARLRGLDRAISSVEERSALQ